MDRVHQQSTNVRLLQVFRGAEAGVEDACPLLTMATGPRQRLGGRQSGRGSEEQRGIEAESYASKVF